MPKAPNKWTAARGARALRRLAGIEASIVALGDEDLLDLADIFVDVPASPLWTIVEAEMRKRGISL